jgi:hypothetical protein
VFGVLALLAACSSETIVRSSAPPGDPALAGEDGGASDPEGGDGNPSAGPGPFALDINVSVPGSTPLFVAVRDADTKELIAISHDEENLAGSVRIKKAGVLLRDHRYEVGVKDQWYAKCLDASANVWFREIPPVAGDVSLELALQEDVGEDPRGCDVLHAPVGLPAGTYATTQPILGIAGNRVSLVVSSTGRIYTNQFQVFCGTTAQCVSTTVTHGACEWEQVVYPDENTFSLGSSAASHTTVRGKATIDRAAKTIRYTGRTYTWTGSSTICCDQTFDVTLTKVGGSTPQCI